MTAPRQRGRPAGRRAAGEGSVYWNDTRNRWEGSISIGSGKNRKRVVATGATKKAAADKLRALAERARTNDLTTGPGTVGQLAERWWARDGSQVQASTKSTRYERIVLHIIDDGIANVPLHKLTSDRIELWLNNKRKASGQPLSRKYLELIRGDLYGMVEWSISRRWLTYNPVKYATITSGADAGTKRTLNHEQAVALAHTCEQSKRAIANFTLVVLLTGARPGEIAGLPFTNVDLDAGVIHIRQALQRENGGRPIAIGPTKTKQTRTIQVDGRVLDAIHREKVWQATIRLAAGPSWSPDWDGLVFLTATGKPAWASNLRRSFRDLCADADAGIPADFDPYELRHTCASLLADAGWPITDIVDQLGHADERMLWQNYRHRVDPFVRNAAAISRIFAPGAWT